ncbi:MAG: bifunctional adenosylcobinamide kinase/adenosylcobinamide-phosphate guanylyltransferase [Lachnospiraceae bacterium]|nr:bifunctional adenosylcobinamide kinase/adenosylcobinamide-phosphate guanylyltransferase [Lachnospiraceae bacterium]
MITLVIGGPDSGKSLFAESLADTVNYVHKYYIATMKIADKDAEDRRKRHVKMREGKGFETLEIPYRIDDAVKFMQSPENSVVLLECAANLVGNAMHEVEWKEKLEQGKQKDEDVFICHIVNLVTDLADKVGRLIVVSSEYEMTDAAVCEDAETQLYVKLLHAVNLKLLSIADRVYERKDE